MTAMGLDIVEFIMEIETKFRIRIPDQEAQHLTTPRRCIDYVYGRMPQYMDDSCLSQKAFYRLRRVLIEKTRVPRSRIHPRTAVLSTLPNEGREQVWASIGFKLGASDWWWPELSGRFPPHLGTLAKLMVYHNPQRECVAEAIRALIDENLGVNTSSPEYDDDLRFSEDMGIE
jgi:acyl carrier protein